MHILDDLVDNVAFNFIINNNKSNNITKKKLDVMKVI